MGKKGLSSVGLKKCKDKGRFVMVINGILSPGCGKIMTEKKHPAAT